MSARTPFLVAGLAVAASLIGYATTSGAEAKPSTDDEKTIYALGLTLAHNLEPFQLSGNELDVFLAGMRDGITGAKPQVDIEQFGPKIRPLAQARSEKMAAAEKAASADFLAKEAGAKGATKSPSGLIIRVIKEGTGASPTESDTVKVHYHGTLRDGSVFDSSVERGEPATFPANRVIPCWTEALKTMKVGEKAHITCPSDIAYGDHGSPPRIKPGAALAFDVELLEIVKTPAASARPPAKE
jgi:FKBP-type peptidyl-prolyl cis-trans isomerase FkpA/FKBP-type peptidyl-prolyl cis-trans isomerase FklB